MALLSCPAQGELGEEHHDPLQSSFGGIERRRVSDRMHSNHIMNTGAVIDRIEIVHDKMTTTSEIVRVENAMAAQMRQMQYIPTQHNTTHLSPNPQAPHTPVGPMDTLQSLNPSNDIYLDDEQGTTEMQEVAATAPEFSHLLAEVGQEVVPRLPSTITIDGQTYRVIEMNTQSRGSSAMTANRPLTLLVQVSSTGEGKRRIVGGEWETSVWSSIRNHPSRPTACSLPPEPCSIAVEPQDDGSFQGIPFGTSSAQCSREELISFRVLEHFTNNNVKLGPTLSPCLYEGTSSPFRPSRTHRQAIPKLDHQQLRHMLVSSSSHDAYYSRRGKVFHVDPMNPIGSKERPSVVMDIEHLGSCDENGCRITTLNTVCGDLLFAGTLKGQYGYIDLSSDATSTPARTGQACPRDIINYIDSTCNTPNGPTAVIACNDYKCTLSFVDCTRNEVISRVNYHNALTCISDPRKAIVNCTATSPDGRLRICVGDFNGLLLTDARTGDKLAEYPLSSHHQQGRSACSGAFACAWADDGFTLATGSEDQFLRLWDGRNWSSPVAEYPSLMGSVRNTRFSPLGAGPLTLLAGETVDVVHAIDVRTAQPLQLLHYFGDNAGLAFSPDGRQVLLANADEDFGGVMVWERSSWVQPFAEMRGRDSALVYRAGRHRKRSRLVGGLVRSCIVNEFSCYV